MIFGHQITENLAPQRVNKNRRIVWIVALAFICFGVWAANAPLDEVVRAMGRVVPAMHNQTVQNLEGGIIRDIYVAEGDIVAKGDLIVAMDKTQFESAYQELQEQRLAFLLRLDRLDAERHSEDDFVPDQQLAKQAPQYAASELALFTAHRTQLQTATQNLENALTLKNRELELLRPMLESQAVSEITVIKIEQEAIDIQSRIDALTSEFEIERSQTHSDALTRLGQVEKKIRFSQDQLERTAVRSPVDGIVNDVMATTIGGVVRPGDPLVEILPINEQLRVEGRVSPQDIGFVFTGMPATIKLTAFDFSIYGTLAGQVVHVGADTVVDESEREPRPYYEVYITLDKTSLEGPSGQVEIRPGMQATLELKSGHKTVLQYLLKPLFKTREALSER